MSGRFALRGIHTLAIGALISAVGLVAGQSPAAAANGDLVQETSFGEACGSGLGVGIAFDGTHLWYSCYNSSPDLHKADPLTGDVLDSYDIAGGLGALAWDGNRKKIWVGWGGGSGSDGDVRLFDPDTGAAPVQFNAGAAAIDDIDDGLAYDAQSDTLLISADTSTTIHEYSVSGAELGSFDWAGDDCYNSGLAIGGDLLFQGSNGCNQVWAVQRGSLAAAFDFPTGGTRDEDLECDSVTFSPKTVMWSVEAFEPRRAIAFEIPPGSCATGGGVDSDGDGLLDEWETSGVWIDPDGAGPTAPQFTDLPAMGADANKPDIFLHVDWMQDAGHSHALTPAAIETVVDSFAGSPHVSPTGSVGVNLHVDQGPGSVMDHATGATWGALSRASQLTHVDQLGTASGGGYDWSAFQTLKDDNFTPTGRTPLFHYVISAHNYDETSSSGLSRGISASDFIVSLGSFTGGVGTDNQQAGTLMHELGHNLNLRHGGDDNVNYKPNYLSVMSYAYQLGGVIKDGSAGTFDYSRSQLDSLNESSLSEPDGIGAPGFGTRHFCAGMGFVGVSDASGPIDWSCDGDTTDVGVAADINNSGSNTTLGGHDDWANLQLKGGAIGLAGIAPDLPAVTALDLLTPEEAEKVVTYEFNGFFGPIDNPPDVNDVKAGAATPIKFSLGGDEGLNIFTPGSPGSQRVSCDDNSPIGDLEPIATSGSSGLTYDPATDEYSLTWKTDKDWAGSCRQLVVMLNDGTQHVADFQFK